MTTIYFNLRRPVAADFMIMEFEEEDKKHTEDLDIQRFVMFIRGEYVLEEGEVLAVADECTTINRTLDIIFYCENIKSRDDLDVWCGNIGRKKLYNIVSMLSPEHYNRVNNPCCLIRACYETKLIGFKRYNGM